MKRLVLVAILVALIVPILVMTVLISIKTNENSEIIDTISENLTDTMDQSLAKIALSNARISLYRLGVQLIDMHLADISGSEVPFDSNTLLEQTDNTAMNFQYFADRALEIDEEEIALLAMDISHEILDSVRSLIENGQYKAASEFLSDLVSSEAYQELNSWA